MSRWGDPRLALWRSAEQKAIRRGSVDLAASVANELLSVPGGKTALARRLSMITAEDVGARWLPAVVATVKAVTATPEPDPATRLIEAAAALASLPKDKNPYFLAATCWAGRHATDAVTPERLTQALDDGDYKTAVATYIAAREARQWRSGVRVIDAMRHRAATASRLARAITDAALWREAQGGSGTDELIAAAVIALIEQPGGEVPDLPSVTYDARRQVRLPWWSIDSHVPLGERALIRVARRHGMSPWRLGDIQFNCESIVLGPAEVPSRWRGEALELDAQEGGWSSHAEGLRLWEAIRPEVQAAIEAELDQFDPFVWRPRP